VLDLGIDLDVWPWIWLTVAVVFALIELIFVGGSFILLPFAVSAFAATILAFYDVAVEVQWAVFALGGGALFIVMYRWSRRFLADHLLPPGVGADRLVGLVGIVTVGISPDDPRRSGRVAVSGEVWGAISAADRTLVEGMKVRITAMEGTRVVVEPVAPPQDGVAGGEHQ
jgi:membrane protein implicated in regulation of membrane protease activity